MQIPTSIIHAKLMDGRGYGPLIAPAYEAKVLLLSLRGKQDTASPGKGVTVDPYPANGSDETRYIEAFSAEDEYNRLRKHYKGDARGAYVDQVYPDNRLEAEIIAALDAEADRLGGLAKIVKPTDAHKSFMEVGLTNDQGLALMAAGFADRMACTKAPIMALNNVPGIPLDTAKMLATEPPKDISKAK
jgi:hypothetical protein